MIDGTSNQVGAHALPTRKPPAPTSRQEEGPTGPAETVSLNRDNYPMGIYGDDGSARGAAPSPRELNAKNYPAGFYAEDAPADLRSVPFVSIDNAATLTVVNHELGHSILVESPSSCHCDLEAILADPLARGLKEGDAEIVRKSVEWMKDHFPMGIYGDDGGAPTWNLAGEKDGKSDGIYS